ncbi:MAG: polyisoprenoid-binding protein [Actinobacteria bacterium]|nr:polyisoprenoid-binding protein [Actinomycetota bacterium]MBA3561639.1 polyisoprenoid-binding protein [Actinomycetota bacterium]MBA3566791.1 polyisoprenoid-binding protein [Actinomycetota bacterium]
MTIVADTSATVIPTGTWSIDPVWSSLEFEIKKLGLMTVKGRIPGFSGTIEGGEAPSITGSVDASTITTFDDTRDGHLQSPEFFDTERYPELRFESTAVATKGDELIVEGDLTIKGVTKPIELTGSFVGAGVDPYGNDRIGIELAGAVDRTDFGLNWNAPLPGGDFLLPNEVVLRANLAAVKAV